MLQVEYILSDMWLFFHILTYRYPTWYMDEQYYIPKAKTDLLKHMVMYSASVEWNKFRRT